VPGFLLFAAAVRLRVAETRQRHERAPWLQSCRRVARFLRQLSSSTFPGTSLQAVRGNRCPLFESCRGAIQLIGVPLRKTAAVLAMLTFAACATSPAEANNRKPNILLPGTKWIVKAMDEIVKVGWRQRHQ